MVALPTEPNDNGEAGRDETGRFAPGNKLAKGNPVARKMRRLRQAITDAATPEQAVALLQSMYDEAVNADNAHKDRVACARVWLDYAVGRPSGDDSEKGGSDTRHYTFIFSDSTPESRQQRQVVENLARREVMD